jgi:hypothetical protein
MNETQLFTSTELQPQEKPVRGIKAVIIRQLISQGWDVNKIVKQTGFTYNYVHKTFRNYPEWKVKQDAKDKVRRLGQLLRGERVKVFGTKLTYLHHTKTHVYFINVGGKIENMKKEDFVGELI